MLISYRNSCTLCKTQNSRETELENPLVSILIIILTTGPYPCATSADNLSLNGHKNK